MAPFLSTRDGTLRGAISRMVADVRRIGLANTSGGPAEAPGYGPFGPDVSAGYRKGFQEEDGEHGGFVRAEAERDIR